MIACCNRKRLKRQNENPYKKEDKLALKYFIINFMNRFLKYVPRVGLEPTLCYQNWILNPARLPIPPPRQGRKYTNLILDF